MPAASSHGLACAGNPKAVDTLDAGLSAFFLKKSGEWDLETIKSVVIQDHAFRLR